MDNKAKGRKWRATKATLILEFAASIAGIVKFLIADDATLANSATNFVLACFGAIAGTLAFYFTANVLNDQVRSKNFHSELVDK